MVIYMDNNSTTKLDSEVARKIANYLSTLYANPSSSHHPGQKCRKSIENSRSTISQLMKVKPCEIFFTAGATESNNLAIRGILHAMKSDYGLKRPHIITSAIEHASIGKTLEDLKNQGLISVSYVPVDKYGVLHPQTLKKYLRPETILVTIMLANNEIGTIQPIKELVKVTKEFNPRIHFHCDGTQMIGKYRIYPKKFGFDSCSASGHKFHAMKGCGFIWLKKGCHCFPCETGGHQEQSLRSGTENIHGIVSMGLAMKKNIGDYDRMKRIHHKINRIREFMEEELRKKIPNIVINGHPKHKLINTVSICLPKIDSRKLLKKLDDAGICVNVGSACNQGARSWVLEAIGLPMSLEKGALRISLCKDNSLKEAKYVVDTLSKLYKNY